MFAKLASVLVCIGLCGGALVVIRDLRVRADQELARAHLRNVALDSKLWKVRAEIAKRLTPEHIRELAAPLGELEPITLPEEMEGRLYLVPPAEVGRE